LVVGEALKSDAQSENRWARVSTEGTGLTSLGNATYDSGEYEQAVQSYGEALFASTRKTPLPTSTGEFRTKIWASRD
jgi:hypothetical protein|tara:strand:- start:243 stop:473 length:231 start_codon:yes stop_codon:yes gene_type:complete